jgi:hypothetical protein
MRKRQLVVFGIVVCLASAEAAHAQPAAADEDDASIEYVRLGYTGIVSHEVHGAPGFAPLGFRHEYGRLAIDVSGFNLMAVSGSNGEQGQPAAWSLFKAEVLRFSNAESNRAFYGGGGVSYGGTFIESPYTGGALRSQTSWYGSGLQGEGSAGLEWGRMTHLREFLQIDVTLPFYQLRADVLDRRGAAVSVAHRYAPSVMVSYGLGWQHGHRRP